MNLGRLKWVAIALPLAFVAFLRLTTEHTLASHLEGWSASLIFFTALGIGVFVFASLVFGWLDRAQRASEARARELQALNDLGRRLNGSLDSDAVLTAVLETASEIIDARAVAVALNAPDGCWRAVGEGRDDLEAIVTADAPEEPWRHDAARVFTHDGRAAMIVSAPVAGGAHDRAAHPGGTLYALLDGDAGASTAGVSRLLHALANHTGAALQRCRLFDDVQRREQRTRALYDVGIEIASSQDLSRVLRQVTAHACKLVRAKAAVICLLDEPSGCLSLVQAAGDVASVVAPGGDGSALTGAHIRPRLADGDRATCPVLTPPYNTTTVRSPLIVGSDVVGELCIVHDQRERVDQDERALLAGLADMAAIAIHNSRLLERERQVAVLEERDHLAREMHDTLAQVLGYLHLKAATTGKRLEAGEVERAHEELQEMQDLAHEAYVDVREAILGLRETVAPAGGLVGSLQQYLQKFGRQAGIEARLLAPTDVAADLAPEAEIQLLRVVQEALTNVRKHAGATSAIVRVENEDQHLRISIEDDGRGFDASRIDRAEGRSFGLRSMKERVERAGGRLSVASSPGAGTQIIVLLPLQSTGGRRYVPHESPARR
ncbi:MAG: GAF domain-containing sensor histidine kinase [Chloroflexota bacterium]|nr:GAF domain-containing sensor histidine kinase [Chloroflexota bacterium]